LVADEMNATYSPVSLSAAPYESLSPTGPRLGARLTSVVVAVPTVRTYTSLRVLVSSGCSGPSQSKATRVPSSLMAGDQQSSCPGSPFAPPARLTSVTSPVCVSLRYTLRTRSSSPSTSPSDVDAKAT
jgi:hypothetical protein